MGFSLRRPVDLVHWPIEVELREFSMTYTCFFASNLHVFPRAIRYPRFKFTHTILTTLSAGAQCGLHLLRMPWH